MRFPEMLWYIVNKCTSGAITWGENGDSIVMEYNRLKAEVLNKDMGIFKTSKIDSFVRQLNLYGFRKCSRGNENVHEFKHPHFLRGRKDLIDRIRRKRVSDYINRSSRGSKQSLFKPTRKDSADESMGCTPNEMFDGQSNFSPLLGPRFTEEESWWNQYQLNYSRFMSMQRSRNIGIFPGMMPVDLNSYATGLGSANFPQWMIPNRIEPDKSVSEAGSNLKRSDNHGLEYLSHGKEGVNFSSEKVKQEDESLSVLEDKRLSNELSVKSEAIESENYRFFHRIVPKESDHSLNRSDSSSPQVNTKETLALLGQREVLGVLSQTSQKEEKPYSESCSSASVLKRMKELYPTSNKASGIFHRIAPKNNEACVVKLKSTNASQTKPQNYDEEKENLGSSETSSTKCDSGEEQDAKISNDADSRVKIGSRYLNDPFTHANANPYYFFMPTPNPAFYPGYFNGSQMPFPFYMPAEAEMREHFNRYVPGYLG